MPLTYRLDFSRADDTRSVLGALLELTADRDHFTAVVEREGEIVGPTWILDLGFAPGAGGMVDTTGTAVRWRYDDPAAGANGQVGIPLMDDRFHFYRAALAHGHIELVRRLVMQVGELQGAVHGGIWCDEEALFGSTAALLLALEDVADTAWYTRLLAQIGDDTLDHETLQGEALGALVARHGYDPQVLEHICAIAARTQSGDDFLESLCADPAFAEHLRDTGAVAAFAQLLGSVGSDESRQRRLGEIDRHLAPSDHLLVDVAGKHVVLMGTGPLAREEFQAVLTQRGAQVQPRPTAQTELLIGAPCDLAKPAAAKAREAGVQVLAYDAVFSKPAYENWLAERRAAFAQAIAARDLPAYQALLTDQGFVLEERHRREHLIAALDGERIDACFTAFADEFWPSESRLIIGHLLCDASEASTGKLAHLLERFGMPVQRHGAGMAMAVVQHFRPGRSETLQRNLRLLVEHGLDITDTGEMTSTPLHEACDASAYDFDLIALLLACGAEIDAVRRGRTPLGVAAGIRDRHFYRSRPPGAATEDDHGYATDWHEPGIERCRYPMGDRGAQRAADYQKGLDLVKFLVEAGADLDFERQEQAGVESPVMCAARARNWQILDYLLDVSRPNRQSGHTTGPNEPLLCWLARNGRDEVHLPVFRKALDQGAHPDAHDNFGRNALFYAVWRQDDPSLALIAELIDRGADPFRADGNGDSCASMLPPLIDAAGHERLRSLVRTEAGRATVERLLAA